MQRPGEAAAAHRRYVRNSTKVIVILGLSFLFLAIENALDGVVPVSGLLAVVSMACVLKRRSVAFVSKRLFCAIAYLPKATVQAVIGSVPLALGLPCGQIVLSVAVLAILVTAPLGAFGIDLTYRRLLQKESRGNAQRTG